MTTNDPRIAGNIPRRLWVAGATLCALRLLAWWIVRATAGHDAQWQLAYAPLWVADLPVSVVYLYLGVPIPIAEAVIGPVWWFLLPVMVWRGVRWWSRGRAR